MSEANADPAMKRRPFEAWHKNCNQTKKYDLRHAFTPGVDGPTGYHDHRTNRAFIAFCAGPDAAHADGEKNHE